MACGAGAGRGRAGPSLAAPGGCPFRRCSLSVLLVRVQRPQLQRRTPSQSQAPQLMKPLPTVPDHGNLCRERPSGGDRSAEIAGRPYSAAGAAGPENNDRLVLPPGRSTSQLKRQQSQVPQDEVRARVELIAVVC